VFFAIVALTLGYMANNFGMMKNVYRSQGFQRKRDSCRSLANTDVKAKSCEDFRFVSDNIIITGHGEISTFCFLKGVKSHTTDHLIAIDLNTELLTELPLTNFPKGIEFRPHGFEVKNNRVYVVNHAQNLSERVEIFELSNPTNIDRIAVKWIKAIEPPVPRGSLNSITAVSDEEIYVTHWLPRELPKAGLDHPETTEEKMNAVLGYAELLGARALGIPPLFHGHTGVYRCLVSTGKCDLAFGNFISSNGIAASPKGDFIFVADCMMEYVAVFARDGSTGKLTLKTTGKLPYAVDNVMLNPSPTSDGTFELWLGTMPDFVHYLTQPNGNPGGIAVGKYDPVKNSLTFVDYFTHDGAIVSGVATAAKWKNFVLLSGPKFKGGIAICDVAKDRA